MCSTKKEVLIVMNLQNDEVKRQVISLRAEGNTIKEIEYLTGIPRSTVQDFLSRITHKKWWDEYSGDEVKSGYKMVFLDIEVAPATTLLFNMFNHFSTPDHIEEFPYILTAAWNWLHDDKGVIHHRSLPDYPAFKVNIKDDSQLVYDLWQVLDECDILVAQNAKFDKGWISQQFALHGLPEPSPYRIICTLKNSKGNFALPSNSLGYVVKYFRLEQEKLKHDGIDLWKRCKAGDLEAFDEMVTYNRGDIPTLRDLYLTTRAHIEKHPNLAIYFNDDEVRCPVCGSSHLSKLDGKLAFTNLSKFQSYRCGDCGTVKRDSTALNNSQSRKNLLRNVIR